VCQLAMEVVRNSNNPNLQVKPSLPIKRDQKTSHHSNTGGADDRFIPNRAATDMVIANYCLSKENGGDDRGNHLHYQPSSSGSRHHGPHCKSMTVTDRTSRPSCCDHSTHINSLCPPPTAPSLFLSLSLCSSKIAKCAQTIAASHHYNPTV